MWEGRRARTTCRASGTRARDLPGSWGLGIHGEYELQLAPGHTPKRESRLVEQCRLSAAREIARRHRWTLITAGHERRSDGPSTDHVRTLDRQALIAHGLKYEDLVAAADVVVSKPGYGIVSECAANGAALLYTSRGRFPEYEVLTAEMPRFLRCRFISQEHLLAGNWSDGIAALLGQQQPPESPPTNGAERAAERLAEAI